MTTIYRMWFDQLGLRRDVKPRHASISRHDLETCAAILSESERRVMYLVVDGP